MEAGRIVWQDPLHPWHPEAEPDTIHAACSAGDTTAVQHFLGADPAAAWEYIDEGWLPLHVAMIKGHTVVVRLLLQAAPEAAMRPALPYFLPLHMAALEGHSEVVRLLLEAAPEAMWEEEESLLPIHAAAYCGHDAVVRLLLEAGPETAMAAGRLGRLPLHDAARGGHAAVARWLLDAAPAAATTADESGQLPLHTAAECASRGAAVVQLLLEATPQAASAADTFGRSPLHLSLTAESGPHTAAAHLLLSALPTAAALSALADAGARARPLLADYLLAAGRLPLSAADWALLPAPCPGIERVLRAAVDCSPNQAAQVVRRPPPADAARLRTAALCLGRRRCLPSAVTALILAWII